MAVVMTQDPSTHVVAKNPPGVGGSTVVVEGIVGVVDEIDDVVGAVEEIDDVQGTVETC